MRERRGRDMRNGRGRGGGRVENGTIWNPEEKTLFSAPAITSIRGGRIVWWILALCLSLRSRWALPRKFAITFMCIRLQYLDSLCAAVHWTFCFLNKQQNGSYRTQNYSEKSLSGVVGGRTASEFSSDFSVGSWRVRRATAKRIARLTS